MMTDQNEVNQANFAGRLHPSQRGRVLRNFVPGLVLLIAGAVVLVLALRQALDDRRYGLGFPASYFAYLIPVYVAILAGLWITVRRGLEVLIGRVEPITGPTRREARSRVAAASGELAPKNVRQGRRYYVVIGDRKFDADSKLYSLAVPDRPNTGFITPWTKRLVNVTPMVR